MTLSKPSLKTLAMRYWDFDTTGMTPEQKAVAKIAEKHLHATRTITFNFDEEGARQELAELGIEVES